MLLDVVLNHVVSRLHVDPPSLSPTCQEVDGALQKPNLLDNVDNVKLTLKLFHSFAFNPLFVGRFVAFFAKQQTNSAEIGFELKNEIDF